MIKTRKELKETLRYEKGKYNISSKHIIASFFGFSEKGIIWKYQKRLRKWEYYYNKRNSFLCVLFKLLTISIGRKYGLSISPNTFGAGLKIAHLGSILVNSNTRFGKDCTLHINTAFVATGGSSNSPKGGDNISVGVGATLIGDIILGSNIAIGAGAVVTHSFQQDGVVLGGIPAKIISHNGKTAI